MWKSLLDKSKCLLGFHEGPWGYRRPGDCVQVLVCTRCGVETQRVEHRWGDWAYRAADRCELQRSCTRCAQEEQRTEHEWGEPMYARAAECERIAECSRCGARDAREALHVLDRWEYSEADACTQVQACSRCGAAGAATRVQHDWSGWTASDFYESRVRVCRHCGEMVVAATPLDTGGGPSMQAAEAAVDRLLAAGSWEAIRARMTADRETLLSPVAEKYLAFALDACTVDDSTRQSLLGAARLVTRSRAVGIEQAIQDLGGAAAATAPASEAAPAPAGAAERSPQAAQDGPGQTVDERLVGHWRSTEALGGGMVTDSHCVLDRYGDCAWWSRSASAFGTTQSERDLGRWETRGNELVLRFASGDTLTRTFLVEGGRMVWPQDSRYRFWERL